MNEEKIAQLEAQLTGDMFADMDIKDQIHKLKLAYYSQKFVGMTCSGCEAPIIHEVNQLKGILELTVSYGSGNAVIGYDPTQTNEYKIGQAINASGYQVIDHLPH